MKKYISKFHYLTQDLPGRSHPEQAQIACEAGANWIQYRCMSKGDEEMITELHQIASICDDWGATLIIANHYHLLDRVDAQGVHIEALNADYAAIREAITDEKTLGASAADIETLLRIQNTGAADYCGYGPFAHTTTKANDKPLLGYDGYRALQNQNIDLPVIAVGGVQLKDIELLMQAGIYGIAVSSAVNLSPDPDAMVKEIYRKIY
ncbi:thiamine phosphate synthase [Mucilaginibacter phyllosphaerae]|uniref:Thiamine phosphate synthase n=1 Tax=Mucilaginibacter phyllosphaerae TaxID=1812349 RepID=A0A4Y8A5Z0_9SPHI|nr:thiamine phosphate synthase [Mucilaginibacter phyllosphaerae]MBB3971068.1 thiamine-phosphate pyrophosphorylase [Mucilaginibacter phyllosphaerae]TEW63806.1 thiamine phosphate synthase [Mucilaginibacter phyllosphaerae]GGH22282.1 thiamine-phosphate synthase [Mucilaginibacter phyllosphaerae]